MSPSKICGKKEKAPVWQKDWCCEPADLGLPYYTTNALFGGVKGRIGSLQAYGQFIMIGERALRLVHDLFARQIRRGRDHFLWLDIKPGQPWR